MSTSITYLQEPAPPIFTHKQVPCSILIYFQLFFLQFCIMRKIAQFGKYIRSLAIPPWTSFTVFGSNLTVK
jgi:hypothetical protein